MLSCQVSVLLGNHRYQGVHVSDVEQTHENRNHTPLYPLGTLGRVSSGSIPSREPVNHLCDRTDGSGRGVSVTRDRHEL